MSAYVVEDQTINRIVRTLAKLFTSCGFFCNPQEEYQNLKFLWKKGREKLGQALYEMNCDAVDQRYGKGAAKKFRPLKYRYMVVPAVNPYQEVKSLFCFLYQCNEGDIPKRNLYRELKKLAEDICQSIVTNSEKYSNCQWG